MLKKDYSKNRKTCTVLFLVSSDAAGQAGSIHLVGDFNNWDRSATPMERGKDGAWKASVQLDAGREYQFRYLVDGLRWENEWNADKYVPTPYGDAENSVVIV